MAAKRVGTVGVTANGSADVATGESPLVAESGLPVYLLAVDVGGTHTDLELRHLVDGVSHHYKLPSTPDAPARAVADGIRELLHNAAVTPHQVQYFAHGTTVAANAVVQGRCAPTALIATDGFRDLLEIRRQRQPHAYDVQAQKPPSPVPRYWRREIRERQFLFGAPALAPEREDVRQVVAELLAQGVEAIAVCLLHSYADPGHELLVGAWLDEFAPDVYRSLSCDVLPEFREFERTSTTVLNAALGPVMTSYLDTLAREARAIGLAAEPRTMQSNGGLATPTQAIRLPVRTLASGPAAGVLGAIRVAADLDEANLITFDVGGTTADVCLVREGEPSFAAEREVAGYPVRFPMVDVLSVGAGGGSIAWIDPGGFLQVGPHSAGARPGPVCYGAGGADPTVTDANLVLGWLNPDGLLGGRTRVDRDAAARAIEAQIAKPLGLTLEQAALGILAILNENMVQAVRVISIERGHDPREFSLFAFGGGGPLLAGCLAEELGIERVIVPPRPGLLCAQGLLAADLRTDLARTARVCVDTSAQEQVAELFQALRGEASRWFADNHIATAGRQISYSVDLRYRGQSHELTIACGHDEGQRFAVTDLCTAFKDEHRRRYGFAPDEAVEATTFRATASAPGYVARTDGHPVAAPVRDGTPAAERRVYCALDQAWRDCPVYERDTLSSGQRIDGPAIIEQMDSTTIVREGEQVEVHGGGALCLRRLCAA